MPVTLFAWAFTLYLIAYTTGGPVVDVAQGTTVTFATQTQCERQRVRHAQHKDAYGRLTTEVTPACVEIP